MRIHNGQFKSFTRAPGLFTRLAIEYYDDNWEKGCAATSEPADLAAGRSVRATSAIVNSHFEF